MGMDAQRGETSCYVFSACNFCTAGLITVRSLDLTFCCKLLNKNYFQKKISKTPVNNEPVLFMDVQFKPANVDVPDTLSSLVITPYGHDTLLSLLEIENGVNVPFFLKLKSPV